MCKKRKVLLFYCRLIRLTFHSWIEGDEKQLMKECMVNKNNYVAIAKALGIMLMVIGHSGCPDFIYRIIYMFHMPLFFFCSGLFFKPADTIADIQTFVIKKFKGLYFPYVKWSILFLMFHNIFLSLHLYDPSSIGVYTGSMFVDRLLHIIFTMTGHDQLADPFWFFKQLLLSSIWVLLIMYAVRRINSKIKNFVILTLLLLLTMISKFYGWGLPVIWNMSIMFLSSSFFFVGYLYGKYEIKSIDLYVGVVAMLVVILGVYIYDDYLDMLWFNFKNVLLFFVLALIGILMTLSFSQLFEKTPCRHVLYYIGNHTMIILVLHLFVFKFVNLLKIVVFQLPFERISDFKVITENNELFWPVYFVLGVSLPLAFEWVLCKIRCYLVP